MFEVEAEEGQRSQQEESIMIFWNKRALHLLVLPVKSTQVRLEIITVQFQSHIYYHFS